MALSKIRGDQQIMDDTIGDAQINSSAAIATSKLADGSTFVKSDQSVDDEVPSGAIDGVNTSYTVTQTPVLLFLFKNGVKMRSGAGNDFTISGTTITMASAPVSGDVLTASFIY